MPARAAFILRVDPYRRWRVQPGHFSVWIAGGASISFAAKLICTEVMMVTREPAVELFYDPADLDPRAPRLHIGARDGGWEVRDEGSALLSSHLNLPEAIDAAVERSGSCFSEILFREATGRQEWSVRHNADWVELIRLLVHTAPSCPEAAH